MNAIAGYIKQPGDAKARISSSPSVRWCPALAARFLDCDV